MSPTHLLKNQTRSGKHSTSSVYDVKQADWSNGRLTDKAGASEVMGKDHKVERMIPKKIVFIVVGKLFIKTVVSHINRQNHLYCAIAEDRAKKREHS